MALISGFRRATPILIERATAQEQSTPNQTYTLPSTGETFELLHSEDLLTGFRVDVRTTSTTGQHRWNSLTERLIRYDDALAEGVSLPRQLLGRDDGYSRPVTKTAENDFGRLRVVFETIAVWGGASLAVPPRAGQANTDEGGSEYDDGTELVTEHDAARDLAVDCIMEIPLPGDARRPGASGLPPLRFGKHYALGARCVWINGGGHSLREAEVAYRQDAYMLAVARISNEAGAGQPFVHRRYEEISPPVLLLSEQDRLVELEDRELEQYPGEMADRLVLRQIEGSTKPVRRWLLPPRTSIDLVEQHGVLDALDNLAIGAFTGLDRDPASGGFPGALGGERRRKIDFFDPQATANERYKYRRGGLKNGDLIVSSRGSVFRPATKGRVANGPDHAYFPDPLAEVLFLSLRREGRLAEGGAPGAQPFAHVIMNPRDGWPRQARPIALELAPPLPGDDARWRIETATDRSIATVRIRLAPGEEFDLELWCGPMSVQHLADHWLVHRVSDTPAPVEVNLEQLAQLRESTPGFGHIIAEAEAVFRALRGVVDEREKLSLLGSVGALPADDLFLRTMNTTRIPHLSGLRKLKLGHPVRKPRGAPKVPSRAKSTEPAQLQFHSVRVLLDRTADDTVTDPVELARLKWKNFIEGQGGLSPGEPIPFWESQPGATRAFFLGSVGVERRSTRDLRAEARWTDWTDDGTTVKQNKDGRFEFGPATEGDKAPWRELFTIKGLLQEPQSGAMAHVDLAYDNEKGSAKELRHLSYEFGNARARRLSVRFAAHSRFDLFFPTKDAHTDRTYREGTSRHFRNRSAMSGSRPLGDLRHRF